MYKRGIIILLVVYLPVTCHIYGQKKSITLDVDVIPLERLFTFIEEETDYIFLYPESFPLSSPVSVKVKNEKLETVLKHVLPKDYTYKISKRQVLIIPVKTKPLPAVSGKILSVRGVVTDEKGVPLIGASVFVKGTTEGTLCDYTGNFLLNVSPGAILHVSYLGYISREVEVKGKGRIHIILQESMHTLEDVVIIGYGSVKKHDLTGTVSTLTEKDFNRGFFTSPQDLISGKIAGVMVQTDGGAPGGYSSIRIRGSSSLRASNDPLIIIDGIPVDNNGISGLANALSTVNPNDVESFTVLKDASATAIYGSRASNGVIIINTMRGKTTKRINYNGTFSVSTLIKQYDVMGTEEYRNFVAERDPDLLKKLGNADTNWQDEIFRTAFGQDHNLNISGPSSFSPYMVSLGYTNLDGILSTSNMERSTLRLNLNPSFFQEHLRLNLNIKGAYNKSRFADKDAVNHSTRMDPTQPVRNNGPHQQGYFAWLNEQGNFNDQAPVNPVAMLELTRDIGKIYRVLGNVQADYSFHFLPELNAHLNLAYDYSDTDGKKEIEENTSWTPEFGGISEIYTQKKRMDMFESYLNYANTFPKIKGELDMVAGYSYQHFKLDNYYKTMNAGKSNTRSESPSKTQNYLLSFFGRINYIHADKYLYTFTLRNDGSSRFAKGNRWGLFPSGAFSWRIKEESFLKDFYPLSDLKIRLSYGVTGQQDIGLDDYPYLSTYSLNPDSTAMYQIGDKFYQTLRPSGYDANIKWEETRTWNAGVDFSFFHNRLSGSLDAYISKTSDLLNYIPVPAGTNLSDYITTNVGDMENKGVELSIHGIPVSGKDFTWDVLYNFTWNKNKITRLTQTNDPSYAGSKSGSINGSAAGTILINSVGYPANSFYVYSQVYDKANHPLEGIYVDRNGDGTINSGDLYQYKKVSPDIYMGISSRVKYKRWDFSFTGRLSLGNYVYNNIHSTRSVYQFLYSSNATRNLFRAIKDTEFEERQVYSDYYVENASFFRLDNIQAGYELPALLNGNMRLYIYGSVQNVFVITPYSGLDPEVPQGIDNHIYPRPRTFLLNINLTI
ncbi:MAG: TonB-dependent receptor [Candidatus Azobacteroides sp.]|nr:TonB-dependent receptor [Candidatus Azobacteroides sp.]